MSLNTHHTLTNVFCVPSFAYNLLSTSKLVKDTTHQVSFLTDVCYIQDPTWMKVLEIGREENGLYILHTTTPTGSICNTASNVSESSASHVESPDDMFVAHVCNSNI